MPHLAQQEQNLPQQQRGTVQGPWGQALTPCSHSSQKLCSLARCRPTLVAEAISNRPNSLVKVAPVPSVPRSRPSAGHATRSGWHRLGHGRQLLLVRGRMKPKPSLTPHGTKRGLCSRPWSSHGKTGSAFAFQQQSVAVSAMSPGGSVVPKHLRVRQAGVKPSCEKQRTRSPGSFAPESTSRLEPGGFTPHLHPGPEAAQLSSPLAAVSAAAHPGSGSGQAGATRVDAPRSQVCQR